jgi:hypothetical protein
MTYYSYLKVNKGITWEGFLNEDVEVIQALLQIKKLEIERKNKEYEKHNRHTSYSKRPRK